MRYASIQFVLAAGVLAGAALADVESFDLPPRKIPGTYYPATRTIA